MKKEVKEMIGRAVSMKPQRTQECARTGRIVSAAAFWLLAVVGAIAAEPTITIDKVAQRYPWNGMVDFRFTITGTAGTKYSTSFAAKDVVGGTNVTMATIVKSDGSSAAAKENLLPGTYNWVWNAQSDLPSGWQSERVKVTGTTIAPLGGVQLWANGPYWAECNVGATKPEEFGYYFWWGDTVGYKRSGSKWVAVEGSSVTYPFSSDNCRTYGLTKSELSSEGYTDLTGNLAASHDAATVRLGMPWRMPTKSELVALVDNCSTIWTNRNGVSGRLVTGKGAYVSKSVFLPAAGVGNGSILDYDGSIGYCWSSTPDNDYPQTHARYLHFFSNGFYSLSYTLEYRCMGLSIRAVRDAE